MIWDAKSSQEYEMLRELHSSKKTCNEFYSSLMGSRPTRAGRQTDLALLSAMWLQFSNMARGLSPCACGTERTEKARSQPPRRKVSRCATRHEAFLTCTRPSSREAAAVTVVVSQQRPHRTILSAHGPEGAVFACVAGRRPEVGVCRHGYV